MNPYVNRLFESPRRLWITIGCVLLVVMLVMATVLAVRINRTIGAVRPTATATATDLPPVPEVDMQPSLTTRDQEYLDTPTDDPFADLGDPRPFVLAAVAAWQDMDVEAMQKRFLPAALDEVVGNPPGSTFRLTGEPEVITPGPTKSVVRIPTNRGPLEIVVVGVDGTWMVESIGYIG